MNVSKSSKTISNDELLSSLVAFKIFILHRATESDHTKTHPRSEFIFSMLIQRLKVCKIGEHNREPGNIIFQIRQVDSSNRHRGFSAVEPKLTSTDSSQTLELE